MKKDKTIDGLLVQQFQLGNKPALTQLVKRWHKTFCEKAYWIVKDADVAKDIAQDSWSIIINKINDLKTPEMYFLTLDKKESEKIPFFGEKGTLTITSKLEKLLFAAKITGSKNQELLDEYKSMIQQFRGKELDFFKDRFDAQKNNDEALVTKIDSDQENLTKRKYLYTTNFALQHSDKEVAPYIALTELYNANFKLLDTINKSLSKDIKVSKYGLELDKFIAEINENE